MIPASSSSGSRIGSALLAPLVLLLASPLLLWPNDLHWLEWGGLPPLQVVAGIAAFLVVVGTGRRHWLRPVVGSLILFLVWSSCRVLSMGDGYWWRKAAATGDVTVSSPGAGALYHGVASLFGIGAIEWLAPVLGAVATWVWLSLFPHDPADDAIADLDHRRIAGFAWIGSGVTGVFWYGFVEHSQPGIPWLLAGLAAMAHATGAGTERRRALAWGTASLAVAGLCHLQYAGSAAAIVGVVVLARAARGGARSLALDAATVAGVAGAVLAAAAAIGAAAGSSLHEGNVHGGADGRLLTPWFGDDGTLFGDGALLSRDHLTMVANVLLFAVPLALPWAVATAVPALRRRLGPPAPVAWYAAAVAYLAFLACFGFDFGWPVDLDLLVSMSPALSLPVAAAFATAPRPRTALGRGVRWSLFVGSAIAVWCLGAPLVRARGAPLSQTNEPAATLLLDGHGEGRRGPIEVRWDPARPVQLEVRGPPGDPFWVFVGAPAPACGGHPYGSVNDVAPLPMSIEEAVVFHGVLDGEGRAATTWSAKELADGSLPGVQALVGVRGRRQQQRTTAAFFFVR